MINSKGYEENLYTHGCIRTYTGIYVDVANPKPEMFCIEDIAHALSNIPRFGGHTQIFLSVAEHCIDMANNTRDENNKFDVLMHDCSEAYLMDLPTPVKKLIPEYYILEEKLMLVLSSVFGFKYPLTEDVKRIDKFQLEKEWNDNMIMECGSGYELEPKKANKLFLELFHKLKPIK